MSRNDSNWYTWFHRIYWAAWIGGSVLIVLSWTRRIPATIGWIGFGAAGAATVLSYIVPRVVGMSSSDFAALTTQMLETRSHGYKIALERFTDGATLMYEGVCFSICPDNEIASVVVASLPPDQMDEQHARKDAQGAEDILKLLKQSSPEFASAVAGHGLCVWIMSELGNDGVEICRVRNGEVEWKKLH